MSEVNPKHKKNVRVENGVKVIYLQLLKNLYGCMKSALLWYDLYSKTFKSQGVLINPYDRCITNNTIRDKKCTIAWYVDHNKVSQVDNGLNKKVIEIISGHFVNLAVSRGKKQKLPRMGIEFSANGKLSSLMKDCIEESFDFFREELREKVSPPAKKGFQNINESSIRLEKKDKDILHPIVARLLCVAKRGRPGIGTYKLCLCTRVNKITKEDKAKLRRLLQYLKHTLNDNTIFGVYSLI